MNTLTKRQSVILLLSIIFMAALAILPTGVNAGQTDDRPERSERTEREVATRQTKEERLIEHMCRVYSSRGYELPDYCDGENPDPDPEPEPEPEAPAVSLEADPTTVAPNSTSTLTWNTTGADSCFGTEDLSGFQALSGSLNVFPSSTTAYQLTCVGDGGTTTKSVIVTVEADEPEPEPEPTVDHLLITEVMYDLVSGGAEGSEIGGANEWVEIYNPTGSGVDLMNWEIGDGSSNDVISDSSLVIGAGEFLVITNATTTADFWDLEGVSVVYLGSSISGGLANGSDAVILFDNEANAVDAVSYGANTQAFDPPVQDVAEGHSIARLPTDNDTDTAADWVDNDSPNPGS